MIPDLHPDADAFSACRLLPGGRLRTYSITTASRGWHGLEHFIRQCRATSKFVPADQDAFAILDVLDSQDSIIQEYRVRDARAWTWVKRKLHLVVDSTDGDPD